MTSLYKQYVDTVLNVTQTAAERHGIPHEIAELDIYGDRRIVLAGQIIARVAADDLAQAPDDSLVVLGEDLRAGLPAIHSGPQHPDGMRLARTLRASADLAEHASRRHPQHSPMWQIAATAHHAILKRGDQQLAAFGQMARAAVNRPLFNHTDSFWRAWVDLLGGTAMSGIRAAVKARPAVAVAMVHAEVPKSRVADSVGVTRSTLDKWINEADQEAPRRQ